MIHYEPMQFTTWDPWAGTQVYMTVYPVWEKS